MSLAPSSMSHLGQMPARSAQAASHRAVTNVNRLIDVVTVFFLSGMTLSRSIFSIDMPQRTCWFVAYFAFFVLVAQRPNALVRSLRDNILIVLWPVLAVLSILWSASPAKSAYDGFQLVMTILIGLTMLETFGPKRTLRLLFFAFLTVNVGSLLYYVINPQDALFVTNEVRGIYHHKNELGIYAVLLTLSSCALFIDGYWRKLTGPSVFIGIFVLALTRSGTCMVVLSAVLTLVPLVLVYKKGSSLLALVLGIELILASVFVACVTFFEFDIFAVALQSVGKDPTLTGRTVLWDFAYEAIGQRPILGFGYKGWWDDANPSVHFLRFVIGQDLWFFHNSYLETTVGFGYVGLLLVIATLADGYRRTVLAISRNPNGTSVWSLLFLTMLTFYSTAENPLFVNHGFHQMLLTMAYASVAIPRRRTVGQSRRHALLPPEPRPAIA